MPYIYFAVHVDNKNRYSHFEELGYWFSYHIHRCESHLLAVTSFHDVLFMDEPVALAWKFAGAKRDFIRISGSGSKQHEQLPADELVQYKPHKVDYMLTDEDKANAVVFMKIIAKDMAHRYAANLWRVNSPQISPIALLASTLGISPPIKKNTVFKEKLEYISLWLGMNETMIDSCTTISECTEAITKLQFDMGL